MFSLSTVATNFESTQKKFKKFGKKLRKQRQEQVDNVKDKLKENFGFSSFKNLQEPIIKNLLEGNNSFVIMPTGGGKSLCYQLPAIILDGTAIVISPLIALMKNQVDLIRSNNTDPSVAHVLNSTLNKEQIENVKQDVSEGKTKLLFVAPETLSKNDTIEFLKKILINYCLGR